VIKYKNSNRKRVFGKNEFERGFEEELSKVFVRNNFAPVDTGGKSLYLGLFIFLDTDPHLASVCVFLYLFSVSRYESCVCVGTCVRVCV
jgi:hypothetical protein